jgi:hypothetical protein
MKKIMMAVTVALVCVNATAQYKKASFLNKSGRTNELGFAMSFIPNGGGAPVKSLFYSGSLEGSKRVSLLTDIEFMLKGKFAYTTQYFEPNTVNLITGKLTGQSGSYLLFKYGVQYRFINPAKTEETKLVPYLKLGIMVGLGFKKDYQLTDNNGNSFNFTEVTPTISDVETPFGLEGGAGATYYITKNLGIKAGVNYRQVILSKGLAEEISGEKVYSVFKSNPSIAISLKYRFFREN